MPNLDNITPLDRLLAIMATLRHPERGCPWDRAQTPASLVPYTLEEAYEVADAVAQDDSAALCTELGDLLFQVVFQARIAEEQGLFDFMAIAAAVADKLVQRHPHVFGDAEFSDDQAREQAWEHGKARERQQRQRYSAMDDIPLALPSLARASKLQRRAARLGFDWDEPEPVIAKIHEEIAEVQAELTANPNQERLTDEMGDVLFAIANWARHLGVDPEAALRATNRKFERRFRWMEQRAQQHNQALADLSLADQEALWQQAKRHETPPT